MSKQSTLLQSFDNRRVLRSDTERAIKHFYAGLPAMLPLSRQELAYLRRAPYKYLVDDYEFAHMFEVGQCITVHIDTYLGCDLDKPTGAGPISTEDYAIRILGLTVKPMTNLYCSFTEYAHTVQVQFVKAGLSGITIESMPGHDLWLTLQDDKKVGSHHLNIHRLVQISPMSSDAFDKYVQATIKNIREHIKIALGTDTIELFSGKLRQLILPHDSVLDELCPSEFKQGLVQHLDAIDKRPRVFKDLAAYEDMVYVEQQAQS